MSQDSERTYYGEPEDDRVGETRRRTTGYADVREHDAVQLKNRVQFGPILAGLLTAIVTMLILTVLGLAIGASALEPAEAGQATGTAAAIWGIVSAVIAFFLGGWVAAKTAAVAGPGSGLINGIMVGAAVIAIILWLTGSGVSAVLGTIGGNIGDIVNLGQSQQSQEAQQQAQQIDPQQAFSTAQDAAWGTLAGLIVPLVAAGIGGVVGHNKREDVIQSGT